MVFTPWVFVFPNSKFYYLLFDQVIYKPLISDEWTLKYVVVYLIFFFPFFKTHSQIKNLNMCMFCGHIRKDI